MNAPPLPELPPEARAQLLAGLRATERLKAKSGGALHPVLAAWLRTLANERRDGRSAEWHR